jgi:MFS family permease
MNQSTRTMRHNFNHLYQDVFWWGILAGSTLTFLSIYFARMGATGFQIGLLAAGPAVTSLIFSMPVGKWLKNKDLIKVIFNTSVLHRFSYLIFILLPLVLNNEEQIFVILTISLVASIPAAVVAIGVNALLADLVPPDWRAHVIGRRNALLALSMAGSTLLSGYILDQIPFPLGYQIVFCIGVIGAGMSSYHLFRLYPVKSQSTRIKKPLKDMARIGISRVGLIFRQPAGLRFLLRSGDQSMLRFDLLKGSFRNLLVTYFLFYFTLYMLSPVYSLFLVNELTLTDGEISIANVLFFLTMLGSSMLLSKVNDTFGDKRTLTVSVTLYFTFPFILGIANGFPLVLLAHLVAGGVYGIANGSMINHLFNKIPEDDMPPHMAMHNVALNLAILAGSFIGPLLGDLISLRYAILIIALLRLFAGLLLGDRARKYQ